MQNYQMYVFVNPLKHWTQLTTQMLCWDGEINTLWYLRCSADEPVVMLEFRSRSCQQPSYIAIDGDNSQH